MKVPLQPQRTPEHRKQQRGGVRDMVLKETSAAEELHIVRAAVVLAQPKRALCQLHHSETFQKQRTDTLTS